MLTPESILLCFSNKGFWWLKVKVAVVGGSVAGLHSAIFLLNSRLDCEVSIIEKKKAVGDNIVCAGGLASYMVKRLELQVPDEFVARRIRSVRFYSPSLDFAELMLHKEYGLVLWRDRWEKWLGEEACRLGAKIRLRVRNPHAVLKRADVIVGADGIAGASRRLAGKPFPKKDDVHIAMQAVGKAKIADEEAISMYFGREIAPEGYGWCLTPDTLVITSVGPRPISKISTGMHVLTRKGWNKVEQVFVRSYDGEVIGVTPWKFNYEVKLTPEHLVFTDKGWVQAGNLTKSHHVFFPKPTPQEQSAKLTLSDYYNGVVIRGFQTNDVCSIYPEYTAKGAGKQIVTSDGVFLPIRRIRKTFYKGTVYDLKTCGEFATASFLVHNSFPLGGSEYRIGLGVPLTHSSNLKCYFKTFTEKIGAELNERPKAKMIPTAPPEKTLVGEVMGKPAAFVGDAGLQTDPSTGGGIAPAILGAKCLAEALDRGDLKLYDRLWKGELYRRNRQRYKLKQILCEMGDREFEMLVGVLKDFKPVSESLGVALTHLLIELAFRHPKFFTKHKVLRRLIR
jgi:flavin-dependent dehydrogenase